MPNITAPEFPDINEAVYMYVCIFALPEIQQKFVIEGYNNLSTLPKGCNEFAVISLISSKRQGGNVSEWYEDISIGCDDYFHEKELIISTFDVDFYSTAKKPQCFLRAHSLETAFKSDFSYDALGRYKVAPLYTSEVKDTSFVDEHDQYVRRASIRLNFSFWISMTFKYSSIKSAKIQLENHYGDGYIEDDDS